MSHELTICHYEDEPSRVDLPGLIEIALYQNRTVENAYLIDVTGKGEKFVIKFIIGGLEHRINYVIGDSTQAISSLVQTTFTDALMHLVDLSLMGDDIAGAKIVEELFQKTVPKHKIWMVTAYEAKARTQPILKGIEIYPKPSPLAQMTTTLVSLILDAVKVEK